MCGGWSAAFFWFSKLAVAGQPIAACSSLWSPTSLCQCFRIKALQPLCSLFEPRWVVLLVCPESLQEVPKLHNSCAVLSPLESTPTQVLILGNLKSFRMNTYKKHRGVW